MKKIIIKESQFRRLVENRTISMLMENKEHETLKLDFGKHFQSGQYKILPEDRNEVMELLTQVETFFKKYPTTVVNINILSSESKVPNNVNPETGERFDVGQLSEKRGVVVAEVLKDHLSKLGINPGHYQIKSNSVVGGPEWTRQDDPKDPKFQQHQFVRAEFSLTGETVDQAPKTPEEDIDLNLPEPRFINGEMELHINFVQSKTDFIDDAKAKKDIAKIGEYLMQNPGKKVAIHGHVSGENPNEAVNKQLSLERAKRVTKELVKMGVNRNQLDRPVGFGSTKPKKRWQDVSNQYDSKEAQETRALNRRIVAKEVQ